MKLHDKSTFRHENEDRIDVRRFRIIVVDCPEPREGLKQGLTWESKLDSCSIGSHPTNDLVIEDNAVSRFHCKVNIEDRGARIRDLESSNGTRVDGVRVESAFLRNGSLLRLGRVILRFDLLEQCNRLPMSDRTHFGNMVSSSAMMRNCFAQMERAAACDANVLFEGDTGTGKTTAAEAIHRESDRKNALFLVVDCSTIAPTLIEDELFGHEKNAFTGATSRRKGVFEEADGGTLFLDEIGELPLDLQAKLLRVVETREVRRLGGNTPIKVNVRVMAATHKNLRTETNAGKFRSDLYYRLDVLRIRIPSLKERPEDIPMLANKLLDGLGASLALKEQLCSPEFVARLAHAGWPGNIRELRNHLERCMIFENTLPIEGASTTPTDFGMDPNHPFRDEKDRMMMAIEREYLQKLVHLHRGNVTRAAEGAKVARVYLHRLLKKYGIRDE